MFYPHRRAAIEEGVDRCEAQNLGRGTGGDGAVGTGLVGFEDQAGGAQEVLRPGVHRHPAGALGQVQGLAAMRDAADRMDAILRRAG
jgi:hypothetical protein